jgi:hypothetical protein
MPYTHLFFLLAIMLQKDAGPGAPLQGTAVLEMSGDIASRLVSGVDRFLQRELDRSVESRSRFWKRDLSSYRRYQESVESNRRRLAHIIGLRDARVPFNALELVSTINQPALVARGRGYQVYSVRWPAFADVHGEGLLLMPTGRPHADIAAIPDADQTPEQIVGMEPGVPRDSQFARLLAESGCRVIVPALTNRGITHKPLTNREFIYRPAFELGRHIIGFEVQKILAAVDWFERDTATKKPRDGRERNQGPEQIGLIGWGEGALLALYAGALDTRVHAVCASGYFDDRRWIWQEPIDRNVFGLLEQFGDAEIASLVVPRALIIEAARGPDLTLPSNGGAPGRLTTPDPERVRSEVERARLLVRGLSPPPRLDLVVSGDGSGPFMTPRALGAFLDALKSGARLARPGTPPSDLRPHFDPEARHARLLHELDRHTQQLLIESPYVRRKFMEKLDTGSLEGFLRSTAWYRDYFSTEVIGRFEVPMLPPNARSRKSYDTGRWTGFEVVLDVFPDVIAYGILLVPKDLQPGERRPVVVCQHGLEGRPQQTVEGDHRAYHDFAAKLAELGFITFAPQNLYIFGDRFRTLQRKANPLKKTLFSIMVPQHRHITDWLRSLPFVDGDRIAFYGLSYGGKSAMRIPPLVSNYRLSICSADFNDWVWKNASTRSPYSYVRTGEYEIFEFDLGSTFNYAEMAALIAPRPFMVERGHFDGVAPDEAVAYEFAKVRFLYNARLGIGDRCEIETFIGPHTINGKGTFEFLKKHLRFPAKGR